MNTTTTNNGFGIPTSSDDGDTANASDHAEGFGLGGDAGKLCLGVFDAIATKLKIVNGEWLFLEFEIMDPDFQGEEYSLGAPKITGDMRGKKLKNARRSYMRIGQALRACGIDIGADQLPLEGFGVVEREQPACRVVTSTYDKNGEDNPTIVWGRPALRSRNGVEVGFDIELKDDLGKFRDYGCGVLPAAE